VAGDDLRDFVMKSVVAKLDNLNSLSSTAHHGGVRVLHQHMEIARARVSFDEDGLCSLPSPVLEESVVLTPVADQHQSP